MTAKIVKHEACGLETDLELPNKIREKEREKKN
jgi:hypothetical protein